MNDLNIDTLRNLAAKAVDREHLANIRTEEATKTAFVLPFIRALGYDIFNPSEVSPELDADFGTKKGEKVDYAIFRGGKPAILFECKHHANKLNNHHASQLFKYFNATEARFGVLTNGFLYWFYTDLEAQNRMDEKPFFEFNLLDLTDDSVGKLACFSNGSFDPERVKNAAKHLGDVLIIKDAIEAQIKRPTNEFIKLLIKGGSLDVHLTPKRVNNFCDLINQAFALMVAGGDESKYSLKDSPHKTISPQTRSDVRPRFWTQLLDYAKTKTQLFSNISPPDGGWISAGSGIRGLAYTFGLTKHAATVELYIDRGKGQGAENKRIFDRFLAAKAQVEGTFGAPLDWRRLDGKQACRLSKKITVGGYLDEQSWPRLREEMVDSMVRLEAALAPQLDKLKAELR